MRRVLWMAALGAVFLSSGAAAADVVHRARLTVWGLAAEYGDARLAVVCRFRSDAWLERVTGALIQVAMAQAPALRASEKIEQPSAYVWGAFETAFHLALHERDRYGERACDQLARDRESLAILDRAIEPSR